jgi:hypothetical protein
MILDLSPQTIIIDNILGSLCKIPAIFLIAHGYRPDFSHHIALPVMHFITARFFERPAGAVCFPHFYFQITIFSALLSIEKRWQRSTTLLPGVLCTPVPLTEHKIVSGSLSGNGNNVKYINLTIYLY